MINGWTFCAIVAVLLFLHELLKIDIKPPFDECLKPQSIYALMLYATFCYLAVVDKIEARLVVEVIMILMAFFYGMKAGKASITGGGK